MYSCFQFLTRGLKEMLGLQGSEPEPFNYYGRNYRNYIEFNYYGRNYRNYIEFNYYDRNYRNYIEFN